MAAGSTFNEAFSRWGRALRQYHGKGLHDKDTARKYLGTYIPNSMTIFHFRKNTKYCLNWHFLILPKIKIIGKTSVPKKLNETNNMYTAGYWTDNGAYYYYKTMEEFNYEETLIELHKRLADLQIPARYLEVCKCYH